MQQLENFLEKLKKIYNQNDFEICKKGFEIKKRKTSFRINTLKSDEKEILDILQKNNLEVEKIDFLKNAYILKNGREKDLWDLDIFKEGKIYLQSVSSQIPVDFLDLNSGDKVLDITASPGGKTTQAQAILKNSGEIFAVDNNQIRIEKLKFTIDRQGTKNIKIFKNDATKIKFEENFFDKIIADLPCSAEGKFLKNSEKSFGYWKEEVVKKNAKLQKEILKNIVPFLKSGGQLIYSTCTISPEENEDIVHFLLCNFKELELKNLNFDFEFARNGILNFENKFFKKEIAQKTKRILPSEKSEGFFIAKFTKK